MLTSLAKTVSALGSFFLAMLLYPDIQRKAQAEVDRVVGRDRLPEFSDEPSLPYVTALVKEVLRSVCNSSRLLRPEAHPCSLLQMASSHPPRFVRFFLVIRKFILNRDNSTAVPHRLTSDDVYNGYHLPSGSIVVGNAW